MIFDLIPMYVQSGGYGGNIWDDSKDFEFFDRLARGSGYELPTHL